MNSRKDNSKPRLERLILFLPYATFFVVAFCLLGWFWVLKLTEAETSGRLIALRLDEAAKNKMQLEKERLVSRIREQDTIEKAKLKRIKRACMILGSQDEFCVRQGDHFVFYETYSKGDGVIVRFFVPAGKHQLSFRLTELEMVGSGYLARANSYGKSVSQVWDLPADSVLRFRFELENKNDNCMACVTLEDENKLIFEQSYEYPKRTLSGTFPGSRAGEDIFRPGQMFRYGGSRFERTEILKMSPGPNSTRCLEFSYQVDSPETKRFLRANDVLSELSSGASNNKFFDSRFEKDDGTGRLFKIDDPPPIVPFTESGR